MGVAVVVVALAAFALGVRRDPRRMRNGVWLLIALVAAVSTVTGVLVAGLRPSEFAATVTLLAAVVTGLLMLLALGVASLVNGVVMLRREGIRFAHVLSLLFGLACVGLVLAIVVVRLVEPFDQDVPLRIAIVLLFAMLPALYLAFGFTAYLLYSVGYLAWTRRRGGPVGAVIVLGAGLQRGDRVGPLLAVRLDCGREALGRIGTADARLIVSGGQGTDEKISEAAAMADYLATRGVDRSRVLLEDRSTTTAENLRYSREVLAEHRIEPPVAVVSNNFHAFRAALFMHRQGLDGYALGAPTAAYYWPSATIREFAAICGEHLVGNAVALVVLALPLLWTLVSWAL